MTTIAIIGPENSQAWQAATQYNPEAEIRLYPQAKALFKAFENNEVDLTIVPIYNTREGENKQYFRFFDQLKTGYWVDNVILQSNLSLGVFDLTDSLDTIEVLVGKREIYGQCEEFIECRLPDVSFMSIHDIDLASESIKNEKTQHRAVIDTAEKLRALGLHILELEIAPHNRTRYAVLGHSLARETGYDATTFVTIPLDDRVGILVDILGEFSKRGINIVDMRSENDIKTQKLQIYLEAEGHIGTEVMVNAINHIEKRVIQQKDSIRLLGSFPRVDMRTKYIKSFGFIGTGAMSLWFADRLQSEGYEVLVSGRSTSLQPEEMIASVDVVVVCVPISVTAETVKKYGAMIDRGKALILLAGESENTINTALHVTDEEVEVMLVHNLWGPQVATMKDKNAIVVRTPRSGRFCSEFEAFLYKHGADIYHDSAPKHDLLMGVGQKLPTVISVALAKTLEQNGVTSEDIASHCTLTSLYPILAMARVHSQNPRTYAEIMSTYGDSRKIVEDFAANLVEVIKMAGDAQIPNLCNLIDSNASYLADDFLDARMKQAKAVDEVLGRMI